MERKHYPFIDLIKYICAVLVVAVHVNPLKDISQAANFVVINIFGRLAVPFFFVCAGFFISQNLNKNRAYLKQYLIPLIKTYLIWSLIYLPFGIVWVYENVDLPTWLYPAALVYGFVNVGTFYHLWYVPALIFSVLVVFFYTKRFRLRSLFVWSLLLYIIGSVETYNAFLNAPLQAVVSSYMGLFFTTRNGLFYGLIFVVIGFIVAKDIWLTRLKHNGSWFLLCFGLLCVEAIHMYQTDGYDFNFLFMLVPLAFFMFQWAKGVQWSFDSSRLRALSSLYYFSHVLFLELLPIGLEQLGMGALFQSGIFRFVSVMLCTHLFSMLIIAGRKFIKNRQRQTK